MDTTEVFQCAEALFKVGKRLKIQHPILGDICLFLASQTLSLVEPEGEAESNSIEMANTKRSTFHNLPEDAKQEVVENVDNMLKRLKDHDK